MNATATNLQGTPTCNSPIRNLVQGRQGSGTVKTKNVIFWFGVVEIALGLISCALDIAAIDDRQRHWQLFINRTKFAQLGQGIWCGVILVLSGVMSVLARFYATKCIHSANQALSTLAVVAMAVLLILSCIAAIFVYASQKMWYAFLVLTAAIGVIITIIHCCYSYSNRSTQRQCEGPVMYALVPQPVIPGAMPNGEIMYYPSHSISLLNPSDNGLPFLPMTNSNPNNQIQFIQPFPQTASQQEPNSTVPPAYNLSTSYVPPAAFVPQLGHPTSSQAETNFIPQTGFVMADATRSVIES